MEYERLIELGVFHEDERLELVGGRLVVREPQRSPHAFATELVVDALRAAFGPAWRVRAQLPVALDEESQPEPDVSVVEGRLREITDRSIPSRPVLIVEVAESSLDFDRRQKASLYARAGIADYWIVNLVHRVLEVYREPSPDLGAPFEWRYRGTVTLGPGAFIIPLAAPHTRIAIADLLP
ncbi:MAG TPA: Uma2 family endonuclease [Methylomirabilota bacterium]|nr:Uma2 family endonuclease [Methylomirabilota bacterium]